MRKMPYVVIYCGYGLLAKHLRVLYCRERSSYPQVDTVSGCIVQLKQLNLIQIDLTDPICVVINTEGRCHCIVNERIKLLPHPHGIIAQLYACDLGGAFEQRKCCHWRKTFE